MTSKKRILSIQGGGERGIDPCAVLIRLEQITGKLTREIFDFVGGTSTGAALTAAIVAGIPAKDAMKVYTEQGPRVFSPKNGVLRKLNLVTKGRQFDNRVLHEVMLNALNRTNMTINDSPIDCMITAGDQMGNCWYFVRDHKPRNAGTTGRASLVDAAVASCCATTYHDPWLIPGFGWFADGGTVSLADPIYQTLVEALVGPRCYGEIDPNDAIVMSLGTGWYRPKVMPDPPDGLLAAVGWVTGSLVGSSKTLALEAAERQWPGLVQMFSRELESDVDEADVTGLEQRVIDAQEWAKTIDLEKVLEL